MCYSKSRLAIRANGVSSVTRRFGELALNAYIRNPRCSDTCNFYRQIFIKSLKHIVKRCLVVL